jgi:hypothetical protein
LVDTGEHLGDGIVGAHISAKSNNGDDLGGSILSIKDLCLPEKLLTLLLLEDLGGITAVNPVRETAGRLVFLCFTLNLT